MPVAADLIIGCRQPCKAERLSFVADRSGRVAVARCELSLGWCGDMQVMTTDEQRPHSERMAQFWPRSIQEYWRQEQNRQINLPGKLLSESIKVDSRHSFAQHPLAPQRFAKRKCYRTLSRSDRALIKRVG